MGEHPAQVSPAEFETPRVWPQMGQPRLRLWPGVVIIVLLWVATTIPGQVAPGTMTHFLISFYSPIVATLALVLWWLLASRLRWSDRLFGILTFVATGIATCVLCDPSFRMPLIFWGLPVAGTAWVGWLVLTQRLVWPIRRGGLVVVLALAWGFFTLLRFDGITGSMGMEVSWRWTPTAEERYLAEMARQGNADTGKEAGTELVLRAGDWPGFRGANRDGRYTRERIATDWTKSPRQLWRQRIGPGWSSFAVVGDRLYTQEQRGKKEAVVCLDAGTGKLVWAHEDEERFEESVSGAGPRATPTFHAGKIYALGARGTLNCLDARTGRKVWSRDIIADSGAKVPQWGFSSSPLVVRSVVMVFAGGPDDHSVLGYHADTGNLAWAAGTAEFSYGSLHPARLAGVEQVLLTTGNGLTAFDPVKGKVLWEHDWKLHKGMARVIQPAILEGGDVLLGTGFGFGTQRVRPARQGDDWQTEVVWKSMAIKPYYNDLVVHQGHLYGFDDLFFTCVSLEDGTGQWRQRGYGHGQVLLLAEQGLLLILSEQGEAVLIEANPSRHVVKGRFQALPGKGKTWNHPVIAHGKLFVRNGEEVACYAVGE